MDVWMFDGFLERWMADGLVNRWMVGWMDG
jgi:hypothetical protein